MAINQLKSKYNLVNAFVNNIKEEDKENSEYNLKLPNTDYSVKVIYHTKDNIEYFFYSDNKLVSSGRTKNVNDLLNIIPPIIFID